METVINRCVITIAVGKPYFLKLAENMLRSFILWNSRTDMHFLLLTDNTAYFSKYRNDKIHIRELQLLESEKSFTAKFKLFEHVFAAENLFVDCDCLFYKDIDFIFDAFARHNFSTIGNEVRAGDFFCEVDQMVKKFDIAGMPKFVGCLYYFKNNAAAKEVFEKAIALKDDYDQLGFIRLNGKENEEPLFSVAMAVNGESPIPNNGEIKADMMYYKNIRSNVLNGRAKLWGSNTSITNGEHIPDAAQPAIVHFNGLFTYDYPYLAEIFRLSHAGNNRTIILLMSQLYYTIPDKSKRILKFVLRPAYRLLFGYRKIAINVRGE